MELRLGFLTLTKCVPLGHAARVQILLERILHALVKAQAVCARELESGLKWLGLGLGLEVRLGLGLGLEVGLGLGLELQPGLDGG